MKGIVLRGNGRVLEGSYEGIKRVFRGYWDCIETVGCAAFVCSQAGVLLGAWYSWVVLSITGSIVFKGSTIYQG
jgi:hypothetical protein